MIDLTVAVPTLNSARYLENTLFSLVHQSGCSLEIIVTDSGSVDDTLAICRKYSIETIYVPPGNMYSAINTALAGRESPWLCYLNSDDFVYPTSYARLIQYGESQNADIVYGECDFVDNEGRYMHSFKPGRPMELKSHFLASEMSFAQPSAIFRQRVFGQLHGFNENYRLVSDFDFYMRSVLAGYKFARLEGKSVCCFRISSTQFSQNRDQFYAENEQVLRCYPRPSLRDKLITHLWKIRNWPNYLIRLLRHKVMTDQYRFIRSMDVFGKEE